MRKIMVKLIKGIADIAEFIVLQIIAFSCWQLFALCAVVMVGSCILSIKYKYSDEKDTSSNKIIKLEKYREIRCFKKSVGLRVA